VDGELARDMEIVITCAALFIGGKVTSQFTVAENNMG